jgi:ribosomal protein L37AE/L43A
MVCPFCRNTISIPPTLLYELSAYGHRVQSAQLEAKEQASVAAGWRMWTSNPQSARKQTLVAVGLMMGGPVVAGLLGAALTAAGVPSGPWFGVLIFASSIGGMGVYLVWYIRSLQRKQKEAGAAQGATVACPHCGASNALAAGQGLERCRFCGGALIASGTVMRDVLAEADQAARRARIERYRAERSGMAYYSGLSAANSTAFLVPGIFLGMLALGTVSFTGSMLFGNERFNPALLGMWVFLLAGVGGLAAYWMHRRDKHRAWQGALDAIVRPLGGVGLDNVSGAVSWFNTYWAGPVEPAWFMVGPYFHSAAGFVWNYPFLVWVDPVGIGEGYSARIHLYVATWFPGGLVPPETGAIAAFRAALLQKGYSCLISDAGLVLTAGEPLLRALHRAPNAAPLTDAVWCAAQMARAIGAGAAEPLPPSAA